MSASHHSHENRFRSWHSGSSRMRSLGKVAALRRMNRSWLEGPVPKLTAPVLHALRMELGRLSPNRGTKERPLDLKSHNQYLAHFGSASHMFSILSENLRGNIDHQIYDTARITMDAVYNYPFPPVKKLQQSPRPAMRCFIIWKL